jgi:hypothetical protein
MEIGVTIQRGAKLTFGLQKPAVHEPEACSYIVMVIVLWVGLLVLVQFLVAVSPTAAAEELIGEPQLGLADVRDFLQTPAMEDERFTHLDRGAGSLDIRGRCNGLSERREWK